jgi:hypothetical protein
MARWQTCNVLREAGNRQLWQFGASGEDYKLERDLTCLPSERFSASAIGKGWSTLWSSKLNIALLPPDQVFLRVLQLPLTDWTETLSMVEFQLEKLSPLPVAQIVWSVEKVPGATPQEQTLVVMVAERSQVEAFIGKLEGQGYQADRLETPVLDRLIASGVKTDGVWLYPVKEEALDLWLAAWWFDGLLRHIGFIQVPTEGDPTPLLREQLLETLWAGELEGWLTSPPRWNLVAEGRSADLWAPVIREISGAPPTVVADVPVSQRAGLTARRAAQVGSRSSLLPPDVADRYRQNFIDKLWMGGLGFIVLIYLAGVLAYLGVLEVLKYRVEQAQDRAGSMSLAYTNALQLKAQIQVLQDQLNLKNAVLDGWGSIVEPLPEELTLTSLSFSRGKVVTIFGVAAQDQNAKITDYNASVRKLEANGQLLFSKVTPPTMSGRGGGNITWSFNCELNRAELE